MTKRSHQIELHFQHARRLHGSGRLAEAEQVYRQILDVMPADADTLHMLGVLALQMGDAQASVDFIAQAITQRPKAAIFFANQANALLTLGRLDDAVATCQMALRHKRDCAEAHLILGHAYSDLGQPEDAIGAYRAAMRYNPKLPDMHNALALALREAKRLPEAIALLREALRRTPRDLIIRGNLAGLLKDTGSLGEAERIYRESLSYNPRDPVAHFNLGVLLLLAGRYAEAWPEWEWRFQADPALARSFTAPLWRGEPLAGRSLLVHAEQGLGDMIQFCRYLALLPRDGRIVLEVQAPLARLMAQFATVDQIITCGDAPPPCELCVPMMSLPLALGLTDIMDIPKHTPYLTTDPNEEAAWKSRVSGLPGLRVGVVWAGNPERLRMDQRRSIALKSLTKLTGIAGVSLVSLQKGAATAELRSAGLTERIQDWTNDLGDFSDTASLIACLDLVIGVDTAVVHLAGALGKPVWLLNRSDTCWRWLIGRDDSPWYPTLRIFRQEQAGDWPGVVNRIAHELGLLASAGAPTH